jgi:hypothetical protein
MDPDNYTIAELEKLLHMSYRRILYRIHKCHVPVQRRGRAYTVNLSELLLASMWSGQLPERAPTHVP